MPRVVIRGEERVLAELELQAAGQLIGEIGDIAGSGPLEQLFRRPLLGDQDLGVGEQIRHRVGEWRRVRNAGFPKVSDLRRQAGLGGLGRSVEIQVHVPDQVRNVSDQGLVLRVLRLPQHVRRCKRKVAPGIAHHGIARLEALDALFLRVDGAEIGLKVAGQPVGEIGDVLGRFGEVLLEARHAGNERGQRVEIRQRIGLDARDLHAPVGGQKLHLPDQIDGLLVALAAVVVGQDIQDAGSGQQDGGDRDAENHCARSHGDSSLDSPTSVLMNATIASLSSSGASRPS